MKYMLYLFTFFLLMVTVQLSAQYSSALLYLKSKHVVTISVVQIRQKEIIDNLSLEFPYSEINSILTSDSSIVYQVKKFYPEIQIQHRDQGYYIDLSVIEFLKVKETSQNNRILPSNISTQKTSLKPVNYSYPNSYTYPNIRLLPLSIVAFGLAWDYYSDVSQLNESIDFFNKYKADVSALETARTRKTILGTAFLIAGIYNLFVSFDRVEVNATQNSLSVMYRF